MTLEIDLRADDAPALILMSHGFTGTPLSMRPWAEFLHKNGFRIRCPLLPGHGTNWQHMNRTGWQDWYGTVLNTWDELRKEADGRPIFLMGLSMGGTLVTRVAEERGEEVSGLVLVNPSYKTWKWRVSLAPFLSKILPATPSLGGDIKKQGATENSYNRTPLRAVTSLRKFWQQVGADLHRVNQPVLVFTSKVDHVVEPANTGFLLRKVSSDDVTAVTLHNSYHVATLDHDAQTIFDGSLSFLRRLTS